MPIGQSKTKFPILIWRCSLTLLRLLNTNYCKVFVFFCFLDQTLESLYNTHRKFEGQFQGKKCALYTGKYGNKLSPTQNTPALQASTDVPTSGCRIWRFWMSAWQPTSQLFGIAVYTLRVTFCLSFVVCHFFTAIVMTWFASGPLMLICINKLNIPFSRESQSLVFVLFTVHPLLLP